MKNRKLFATPMIAVLIISILSMVMTGATAVYTPPGPDNQPYFLTDPDPKILSTGETDLTCTTFTLDVQLYNVSSPKIAGYEFQLWFNSSFIKATGCVPINKTDIPAGVNPGGSSYGPGVSNASGYVWTPINNKIAPGVGRVWVIAAFPVGKTYSGLGPTTAIRITFHIKNDPLPYKKVLPPAPLRIYDSPLKLNGTVLGDPTGKPIPHGVDHGLVSYQRQWGEIGAPKCSFDAPDYAFVCDTVTCTDTSTPNGGAIIARKWTLTGLATNTTAMDEAVMKFHCDGAGDVNVTLTVWDSEGMNDTEKVTIEQREKAGCLIDVYTGPNRFCGQTTTYVGKNPAVVDGVIDPAAAYADAYSPDVMVELFVEVSWNGKPVNHVLVAFEVLYEWNETHQHPPPITYELLNSCVTYRTNETNKDGIATTRFRIPTPCTGQMFGKWLVIATAKIQEVKQQDWLRFKVGYVIELLEVQTMKEVEPQTWEPVDEFLAPCDWVGFDILLKNIMLVEKHVTLVVVVYDDCDVPLGQIIVTIPVPGELEWCTPFYKDVIIIPGIHLPQWTYVGEGKVYVSAFTRLPHDCGTAYCPEISHTIILEWRVW